MFADDAAAYIVGVAHVLTIKLDPELLACSPTAPHSGGCIPNFAAAVLFGTGASGVCTVVILGDCHSCALAGACAAFACLVPSVSEHDSVHTVNCCSNDPATA